MLFGIAVFALAINASASEHRQLSAQSARTVRASKAAKAKAKAAKVAATNAAFASAKARDAQVMAAFESPDNGGCAGHRFRWFDGGRCAPRTFKKRHVHKLAPPAERRVYVTSLSYGGTDQSARAPPIESIHKTSRA